MKRATALRPIFVRLNGRHLQRRGVRSNSREIPTFEQPVGFAENAEKDSYTRAGGPPPDGLGWNAKGLTSPRQVSQSY